MKGGKEGGLTSRESLGHLRPLRILLGRCGRPCCSEDLGQGHRLRPAEWSSTASATLAALKKKKLREKGEVKTKTL